ncbi:D-2-hydroxyacid dehydrogenase family protein [Acuticoccus sp.]|uniref:D-2-hydroxyacid dehydrogenase family protein n=1 Tax=Acuticoccus sp. TaxID=1904378 RepID=UPI003B525D90
MIRIAVIDDWLGVAEGLADWASLDADVTFVRQHIGDIDRLVETIAGHDVLCVTRERTPIGAEVIGRLPDLKLIVTAGRRNFSLDVDAASARGLTVCGTDSSGEGTVELTWALILALAHRVPDNASAMREGLWQTRLSSLLTGKTLGIVGLGRLGARVAAIAPAFGMDVIAWSQNLTDEAAAERGARRVEKAVLFAEADVVTIHTVLSARTRGLVDAAAIGAMKPTATLVNTSRGPIVEVDALSAALRDGRIAGAALDVYEVEPLPADDPLRSVPNLLLTPHVGYASAENLSLFYQQMVEAIAAWRAGTPIRLLTPAAPSLS